MKLTIKNLNQVDYEPTYQAMQAFTQNRTPETTDEIWFAEHPPVYTLGRHSDPTHILNSSQIPVVQTDRGGQVTYHGPGQLMIYCLIDIKRLKIGPKDFVCKLEQSLIETLKVFNILAERQSGMPGVYVAGQKIASLGLRIKQGKTYHGIGLNVAMDLSPFQNIHPCGYKNLEMTQIADHCDAPKWVDLSQAFMAHFAALFHYDVAQ